MTKPDATDLALLNTYPQQTKNYLSIYKPSVALSCQVNGSYSVEFQTVNYDNVTAGSYTNITRYYMQVALIGTAPGLEDVGRSWVRSATATQLRFVESDHINWQDDLYITVLLYTEIIPVFPRIIQDPADDENVIFYKIWDVPYTNQNSVLGSLVQAGSHYAGFGNQVYWSASGTVNLKGESLTYDWEFEGGTPSTYTGIEPGLVTYSGPGHYRTVLKVASSGGGLDNTVRYVSLYDRPGQGSNPPIQNWSFSELGGSVDGRGYSCRIKIREPISDILDGALIIIFSDDYYGPTLQSVHNNCMGREHIKFVGYIENGTIQYNYRDGSVEFSAFSPTNVMEMCQAFSVSVESKTSPTKWYELQNMTVKRAIYHYLAWHSTVPLCCDIVLDFDDRNIQYFDADRTSLFDAISSVLDGAVICNLVSDKLGKLWAFQDASALPSALTAIPSDLTITKSMWAGEPIITERQFEDTCYIEMGGISYDPATGNSSAYLGSAPGLSPAYHGKVDKKQGLALSGQTDLNNIVGNRYAYKNSRYPDVQLKLSGNFANLDIAPQRAVLLSMASGDTPKGVTWVNKPFVIRGINWMNDAKNQVAMPTLSLAEVTEGYAGKTIIIPIEAPFEAGTGGGGGSYSQPPIITPPPPAVTPPTLIHVWDNGTFVLDADTLNFIGNIVSVVQNPTNPKQADIYFDACGCSGTFIPQDGTRVAAEVRVQSLAYPVSNHEIHTTVPLYGAFLDTLTVIEDTHDIVGGTGVLDDYLFKVPFTGYYYIGLTNCGMALSGVSSDDHYSYEVSVEILNLVPSVIGECVGGCSNFPTFTPYNAEQTPGEYLSTDYIFEIPKVFLTAGTKITVKVNMDVAVLEANKLAATAYTAGSVPWTRISILGLTS